MDWIMLIIAGAGEVAGVMGINQVNKKKNFASFVLLFAGFIISFLFLSLSMQTISMGTAYAVWTGIGASGSVLVGMLFFGESKDWKRLFFILLIISAVVGLKLIS
ncbi:DMT family transporter [Oceanobacillus halophilus]|uniref:QacE family quaternary ammonium compound efflux SMR transporter n=1 Tax=Oceanobacillus halophilus TaxID=930130 RepID=A0A495A6P8_9BACI|nr:multidrug efflux SMR transporter [Oceanobacillus halophilus]RKQ35500.1 QacE family quaternary ammonium compound efflux SMR transporter [Oceanobacillus halophilus]